jgi:saxitoxin biosynthesis operon SxtJ-like protein
MSWISNEYQSLDQSPRALRRFGFTVGFVILFLGSFLLWRQRGLSWPLISIGAVLLLAAGLAPSGLKWIHAPWMIASLALGWIVTRILLTTVFFFVVTPIGWLQGLFGKRVIKVAFHADSASYWQTRTAPPVSEDYEKQF